MAWYLDTSAFVKLVVREKHSAALRRSLTGEGIDLVGSDLLRTEALRAARMHSVEALRRTRELLEAVTLVRVTSDICERAAELDPSILRSLDALHVATALSLGDAVSGVITYDLRMAAACEVHGLKVSAPV